jgi:glycerophosphoryl diester phosphodiesterase
MIEFDVLRLPEGRLVLAHDLTDATERTPPTLAEGLDHFAGEAYAGVELDVDLKLPGYEREVVEGIVARDLTGRVLISSQYTESLVEIGRLEPRIRRGWSVPKVRRDYTRSWLAPTAYAVLQVMRRRLPAQAATLIGAGGAEALMAHHLLVSGRLVDAVRGAGGQIYVWTVDDPRRIAHFEALGVDGIITNDPRLFEPAPA